MLSFTFSVRPDPACFGTALVRTCTGSAYCVSTCDAFDITPTIYLPSLVCHPMTSARIDSAHDLYVELGVAHMAVIHFAACDASGT